MDIVTVGLIWSAVSAALIMVSFKTGRLFERIQWNQLIQEGLLPPPQPGKYYDKR